MTNERARTIEEIADEVADEAADGIESEILRALPTPKKEDPLGLVQLDFLMDGDPGDPAPVLNVSYHQGRRAVTYACEQFVGPFPNVRKLFDDDDGRRPKPGSRYAIAPEFVGAVAKAALVAKDQQAYVVQWHVREKGAVLARFVVVPGEDEFVALLMPIGIEWGDDDQRDGMAARLYDTTPPSTRPRALHAEPFL